MPTTNIVTDAIDSALRKIDSDVGTIIRGLLPVARASGLKNENIRINSKSGFVLSAATNTGLTYDLARLRLAADRSRTYSAYVKKRPGADTPYTVSIYGREGSWIEIQPGDARDVTKWRVMSPTGLRNVPLRQFFKEIKASPPLMISAADRAMMQQIHVPLRIYTAPKAQAEAAALD